jgi:predicted metallo-beta-lactamase superfamily hydrolase
MKLTKTILAITVLTTAIFGNESLICQKVLESDILAMTPPTTKFEKEEIEITQDNSTFTVMIADSPLHYMFKSDVNKAHKDEKKIKHLVNIINENDKMVIDTSRGPENAEVVIIINNILSQYKKCKVARF